MKLKQVLINLLGNAVKFTEAPGEVSLTAEQLSSASGECTLRFIIKDTGIGMDEEFIPKIFEAFSQEDATSTNRYGGSGLGMAITKNFVEMMGGDISVESKKGVGSTFTVEVKVKSSDRIYHVESGLKLPDNLRAVVVDDDEIACEHASVVLHTIGIEAERFVSPYEALDHMRKACEEGKPYDILLTDYKMPDMNGLVMTKELRTFDNGDTSVIMLTGYNWDIIDDEAKEDGVDDIMAKPLFTDSLLRVICSVLEKKKGISVGAGTAGAAGTSGSGTTGVKSTGADGTGAGDVGTEGTGTVGVEDLGAVLAGRRVLVAEDVDANAEILADLLELEDIESERAVNGKVAIDMFMAQPEGYYDAILMDVRMPVMDGLTATTHIRALERPDAKTIPIIAMTANVFDEDVERSIKAGMNAHLSKPIEPDKLYAQMAELINR